MTQMNTKISTIVYCAISFAIFCQTAQADEASEALQGVEDHIVYGESDLVDAAQQLKAFTQEGGVGFILDYRFWEGGRSARYVVDAYMEAFEELDTQAQFRVTENTSQGVSIYFIVNGISQGPYTANQAYELIPDIVAQNNFAHGN